VPIEAAELSSLLLALLDAGIDFVLVGGAAAVVHGAPITTQDVDIVHSREPANVARLVAALASMEARIHDIAGRDIEPSVRQLSGSGQSLLRTRWGRLDVLGALHDGRGYIELRPSADLLDLDGRELRVIDLETLIEVKASTGRAKDRLVLPTLIALRRRRASKPE